MSSDSALKDKVILVVDDEPDVLETVEEELDMCLIHKAGDYDTALDYLTQSLKILREIGDKAGEGTTLNNMATAAYARGDYDIDEGV